MDEKTKKYNQNNVGTRHASYNKKHKTDNRKLTTNYRYKEKT